MPKNVLDQLRTFLATNTGEFNSNIVTGLLRYLRLCLEAEKNQSQFPTINMYCNLVMHTELDRNVDGWRILSRVNDAYINYASSYKIVDAINLGFGLNEFRAEMIKLFNLYALQGEFFHYRAGWLQFLGYVFLEISDRPIRFPNNVEDAKADRRAKKIFEDMVAKSKILTGFDAYIPTALRFGFFGSDLPTVIPGLHWQLRFQHVPFTVKAGDMCYMPDRHIGGVGILENYASFKNDTRS